ncbi:MAG: histidine--tRNA ligase [Armatimonadetes bacterium]|nr:histidine--tRNA ligase [Armatimonadota bacterium]
MTYKRPVGTQDIVPGVVEEWQYVESIFRAMADDYGYGEIRTPIFEDTDLFLRSVGQETDIVRKEMYTFEDRGGRSLTLRAEGTAPAVRAYLENNLWNQDRERVVKLYYVAPIFRYDRPQAGRYRQHHQLGLEVLGSPRPEVDAEIITFAWNFFQRLGLQGVQVLLNSVGCPLCTPAYVQKLTAVMQESLGDLCADCQTRIQTNPLRVLDCKLCQDYVARAPRLADELCGECDDHLVAVQATLNLLAVPCTLDHTIVRGLDYYTKTAFEFRVEGIGAQASIGGGGRYDGLVEQCGGKPTPGVGIGIGLERVLLARRHAGIEFGADQRDGTFVVALGDGAWNEALKLCYELRAAGIRSDVDYRRRSLKAQLRLADSERYVSAAILGDDEIARGVVSLKNMVDGEQTEVSRSELIVRLS